MRRRCDEKMGGGDAIRDVRRRYEEEILGGNVRMRCELEL